MVADYPSPEGIDEEFQSFHVTVAAPAATSQQSEIPIDSEVMIFARTASIMFTPNGSAEFKAVVEVNDKQE